MNKLYLEKEALRVITDCNEFEESGEVCIEDDEISIELYPAGLALAPEKLESETVVLNLIDRSVGSRCFAVYRFKRKKLFIFRSLLRKDQFLFRR